MTGLRAAEELGKKLRNNLYPDDAIALAVLKRRFWIENWALQNPAIPRFRGEVALYIDRLRFSLAILNRICPILPQFKLYLLLQKVRGLQTCVSVAQLNWVCDLRVCATEASTLLRLHSSFCHDFKCYSSQEGLTMMAITSPRHQNTTKIPPPPTRAPIFTPEGHQGLKPWPIHAKPLAHFAYADLLTCFARIGKKEKPINTS